MNGIESMDLTLNTNIIIVKLISDYPPKLQLVPLNTNIIIVKPSLQKTNKHYR